jgi:nascent polypeptide-associated complex subunit beta
MASTDCTVFIPFNCPSCAGPDNLDNLRRLAEQFQKQAPGASGAEAGASAGAAQDDDDDVPELVPGETFEEAAEEKKESS